MAQPTAVILVVAVVAFAVAFGAVYFFAIEPLLSEDTTPHTTVPTLYPTYSANPTAPPTATTEPTLTPMRDLTGTWQTNLPTKFNIQIDGSDVGYENRTMTWVITPTDEASKVYVQVSFAGTGRELVADSGYTPDVSPMFLTGTISGTRLTLSANQNYYDEPVGEFSFTSGIIKGTWHDHWTMLYEQNVYTATDGLILARQ